MRRGRLAALHADALPDPAAGARRPYGEARRPRLCAAAVRDLRRGHRAAAPRRGFRAAQEQLRVADAPRRGRALGRRQRRACGDAQPVGGYLLRHGERHPPVGESLLRGRLGDVYVGRRVHGLPGEGPRRVAGGLQRGLRDHQLGRRRRRLGGCGYAEACAGGRGVGRGRSAVLRSGVSSAALDGDRARRPRQGGDNALRAGAMPMLRASPVRGRSAPFL
mmetsp:Transcript_126166/g.353290  ORF Transcript_126166/g.353290 Transcript_126166/m.353290 type:complete len:220 (-) Transcript_126166:49-708(-)